MNMERAIPSSASSIEPGTVRERSLRDLLYVLFGHKKKALAFAILLFAMVAIATFLRPAVYRSEAKLLVRLGRESVSLDPTATIGEVAHINRTYDWEVNSELEILKNREIVEQVVDEIGPGTLATVDAQKPAPAILRTVKNALAGATNAPKRLVKGLGLSQPLSEREKAVRRMLQCLKIQALQNSNVIAVAYKERSPELAREVLDRFIQKYLEKHVAVYGTSNSQQFFERQVSELHAKLAGAEKELQEIKDTTGISSLEEQRSVMVNTIGTLERNAAETEAQLAAANAKVTGIQEILATIPETVVVEETTGFSDYGADLMRSRLYDLRLTEKELAARYKPDSRQLEAIREQVNAGTSILENEQTKPNRTEVKKGVNNTYQQMRLVLLTEQSDATALQSKLDKMHAQLAEAKTSLRTLNDVENRTSQLQREIKLLTDNYSRYFEKLEEARIDHALNSERISNISVLQAATLPAVPSGPPKSVFLALGLVLALAGGVGFAFLCEHLDHSLKTPEDVQEKLQLPTLASIPQARLNTVGPVFKSGRWRRVLATAGQAAPVQWDIPAGVRRHYATFRDQLLLHANGSLQDHYVIGITSCSRAEGVSTVAANLASCLAAHSTADVLLVDANTHNPSLHRIFRARLSPGLAEILMANPKSNINEPIIHRTVNLNVLPAGSANGSSGKIFTSDNLAGFLRTIKQDYRFTVIDMPALDQDSAALSLAGFCDGIVLVVETERLRWETVAKAKQQLQRSNINTLGVLLNKRRFPVPNWIYAAL
jgi:capsular exopolysaccharide synthesis family protein